MDGATFALVLTSSGAALGSLVAAFKFAGSAYDNAVEKRAQQLHYQQLADQATVTIAAKDAEIGVKNRIIEEKDVTIARERTAHDECRRENQRLWELYNREGQA